MLKITPNAKKAALSTRRAHAEPLPTRSRQKAGISQREAGKSESAREEGTSKRHRRSTIVFRTTEKLIDLSVCLCFAVSVSVFLPTPNKSPLGWYKIYACTNRPVRFSQKFQNTSRLQREISGANRHNKSFKDIFWGVHGMTSNLIKHALSNRMPTSK